MKSIIAIAFLWGALIGAAWTSAYFRTRLPYQAATAVYHVTSFYKSKDNDRITGQMFVIATNPVSCATLSYFASEVLRRDTNAIGAPIILSFKEVNP